MNKKGQSLVLFIILLPVIILAIALVVDTGLMYNAKIKGNNLLKEAVEDDLDIDEYFGLNNFEIVSKEVKSEEGCAIITSRVKSVFGQIIGKKEYSIKISNCK